MRYTKPYRTVPQQLNLLKGRGLIITDEARAQAYLERIGYYRLSGYWFPFRVSSWGTDASGAKKLIVGDDFKAGVEFRHIVDLYVFDKKLRIAMLDAIERIEVGLRTSIALHMGQYGPLSYRDPLFLDGAFTKKIDPKTGNPPLQDWLKKMDDSFSRSNEEFAKHFRAKYNGEIPPIWIATELWDFGMLSKLYAGLLHKDRKDIAYSYGIPDPVMMEAWLKSINLVRNICAHHARLWNRPLVRQAQFPNRGVLPFLDHLVGQTHSQTRLYGASAAIRFLLLKINPSTSWPDRLFDIFQSFPDAPYIKSGQTGFPNGWEKLDLWQKPNLSSGAA